jgi:hypothetical protein
MIARSILQLGIFSCIYESYPHVSIIKFIPFVTDPQPAYNGNSKYEIFEENPVFDRSKFFYRLKKLPDMVKIEPESWHSYNINGSASWLLEAYTYDTLRIDVIATVNPDYISSTDAVLFSSLIFASRRDSPYTTLLSESDNSKSCYLAKYGSVLRNVSRGDLFGFTSL